MYAYFECCCSFEKKIANEAKLNPKAFYRYVNSKLEVKSGISDLKNDKGEKISGDGLKAEALNNFFSSVFTIEDTTNMPNFLMIDQCTAT